MTLQAGETTRRYATAVGRMVELLEALLSGDLRIDKFEQALGDELFELRQDATMTEEKGLLSRIQLYLHEFREGNREIIEVYMAAQAALDLARPFNKALRSKTEIEGPRQSSDVVPSSSSRPQNVSVLAEATI